MSTPARIALAVAVVAVAIIIAKVISARRRSDPPTQRTFEPPTQLDRTDFADPNVPWLIAVFTSDTCGTCADVVDKAQVLASSDVAVEVVSYQAHRDRHDRYHIDAVPMTLVADTDGVVVRGFVGPVSASDLWSAVADARG